MSAVDRARTCLRAVHGPREPAAKDRTTPEGSQTDAFTTAHGVDLQLHLVQAQEIVDLHTPQTNSTPVVAFPLKLQIINVSQHLQEIKASGCRSGRLGYAASDINIAACLRWRGVTRAGLQLWRLSLSPLGLSR